MSEKGCLRSFKIEEIESDSIKIKGKVKLNDYKFPETDGSSGQVLKLGSNKLFNWGVNEGALQKDTSVYPRVPEKNSNNGNILYLESKRKAKIKMSNNVWHDFGIINQTPEFEISPESTYKLPVIYNNDDIPENSLDIQVKAVDPEGLNIIYSYVLQKQINGVWTDTDISQIPQLNTITENDLNGIHHFLLKPNIYNDDSNSPNFNVGIFKIIIKASDGINVVNSTSTIDLSQSTNSWVIGNYNADDNLNTAIGRGTIQGSNYLSNNGIATIKVEYIINGVIYEMYDASWGSDASQGTSSTRTDTYWNMFNDQYHGYTNTWHSSYGESHKLRAFLGYRSGMTAPIYANITFGEARRISHYKFTSRTPTSTTNQIGVTSWTLQYNDTSDDNTLSEYDSVEHANYPSSYDITNKWTTIDSRADNQNGCDVQSTSLVYTANSNAVKSTRYYRFKFNGTSGTYYYVSNIKLYDGFNTTPTLGTDTLLDYFP